MEYYRPIFVFFYIFGCVSVCAAQASAAGSLQGQVLGLQPGTPGRLTVEIVADGRVQDRADAAHDGSFSFRQLPAGRYEVRLVDVRGDVLRSDMVNVNSSYPAHVEMRLYGTRQERPASGSVSLRALAKPTPANARKELVRAEKAFSKGDVQGSLDRLNKAVELCPACPEIHNNLGVRYMKLSIFDRAVAAFGKAVELDPNSATAQTNLALALVTTRDYGQAEPAARKALDLDRGSVPARYALGLIALYKRDCTTEAVRHLQAASEQYPRAHLSLATILECRGEKTGAIAALNSYLESPNPEHRERIESWIGNLRSSAKQ